MSKNNIYTEQIGITEKIGLMLGGMGNIPLFALISGFLVYFYTNVIGLNPGAIGVIMLVSKVFDGISDLLLGNLIDKTRTMKGVCRPWILRIAVLVGVGIVMLFTVPDIGTAGKLVYVFISYNVSQTLIYTISTLAVTSLPTYMTRDTFQQTGLYAWNNIGVGIMTTVVTGITLQFVGRLGGTQKSWILVGCVYAAVSILCLLGIGNICKERVNPDTIVSRENEVPFWDSVKSILKNKYWFYVLGMVVTGVGIYAASLQMHTYYSQYILGDLAIAGKLNSAYTMPMLFVGVLLVPISKYFSSKTIMLTGTVIQIAACLLIVAMPRNVPALMFASTLKGVGQSCGTAMFLPMLGATIEYGQWKTGIRSQAMMIAANGTGQKIGGGLISVILGGIMAAVGFDGMAASQSAQTLKGITGLFLYMPVILVFLKLVLVLLYDLDKKNETIMMELQERCKTEMSF